MDWSGLWDYYCSCKGILSCCYKELTDSSCQHLSKYAWRGILALRKPVKIQCRSVYIHNFDIKRITIERRRPLNKLLLLPDPEYEAKLEINCRSLALVTTKKKGWISCLYDNYVIGLNLQLWGGTGQRPRLLDSLKTLKLCLFLWLPTMTVQTARLKKLCRLAPP